MQRAAIRRSPVSSTVGQVQPFIGDPITKVNVQFEGAAGDFSGQQCTWNIASGDASMAVFVVKGQGAAAAYAQAVGDETDGAIDLPGVGDKASRDRV